MKKSLLVIAAICLALSALLTGCTVSTYSLNDQRGGANQNFNNMMQNNMKMMQIMQDNVKMMQMQARP